MLAKLDPQLAMPIGPPDGRRVKCTQCPPRSNPLPPPALAPGKSADEVCPNMHQQVCVLALQLATFEDPDVSKWRALGSQPDAGELGVSAERRHRIGNAGRFEMNGRVTVERPL